MKILQDIPVEFYDDTSYCYDYLNSHKIIGDEDADYNGIFHIHWIGPIDNNKVILQLKSILATQKVEKIFFWIENNLITLMSPKYPNLNQLHKYVEIRLFNKSEFDKATGNEKNKEKIWMYYNAMHGDRRIKTDIFRHIILNIYGGVYTDADTLLLRDVTDIKLKNWSSSWGLFNVSKCAEFCILKLEKGSDVYEQMYLNSLNSSQCFSNCDIYNNSPFNYKHENINLTILPCTFFDIVWINEDKELSFLTFNNFKHFFQETDKKVTIDTLFKGCFAYHWHNNWDKPELKNSFAGKINQQLDEIIEEKYNFKPYKIFQE